MKRFILIVGFSVFLSFLLHSYSIVFDTGSIGVEGDRGKVGVNRWGMRINSPYFSFGGVDTGGDIKKIDDPHYSYSHGLYYGLPSKTTSLFGSTIRGKESWLSFIYGERNGFGFGYEGRNIRAFLYSFSKEEDKNIQKRLVDRVDVNVFYLGLEGKKDRFSFYSFLSFTDTLYFSSMVKGSMDLGILRIDMGYGRLQRLLKSTNDWETSLKLSLHKETAEVSFSLFLSPPPIYSYSYRSLEFISEGGMTIGNVRIEGALKRSFKNGKEDVDASLSLSHSFWKVKISKKSGVTVSCSFDSSSFSIGQDKLETKVVLEENEVEITVDSGGKSSVKGRIEIKDKTSPPRP